MAMPSGFDACTRRQAAEAVRGKYCHLGTWLSSEQLPIVYHEAYNVSFLGVENLHVFDSKKFRKVVASLQQKKLLRKEQVTELAVVVALPNWLLQWRVVKPMRYMVAGTMLAAAIALERGWSINIGGGMHHAHSGGGAGWCMFSNVILALRKLRKESEGVINKVMVIDTDVHQGNGHERDKLKFEDDKLNILDIYNADLWPCDTAAKSAINNRTELTSGTKDAEYLLSLEKALQRASKEAEPDIILYNAGTDILSGDPLGRMNVSLRAVVQRDQMVFQHAQRSRCPISMVLSGGYTANSHQAVSASIENLIKVFDLGVEGLPLGGA